MKIIFSTIAFLLLTVSVFSQRKLIGDWNITNQKQLSLNKDNSFVLVKGPNVFKGFWKYYEKDKSTDELVLYFDSDTRKYLVEDIRKNEIRLYDVTKETVLILTRKSLQDYNDPVLIEDENGNLVQEVKVTMPIVDYFDAGRFVVNPGFGVVEYLDSLPSSLNNKVSSFSLLLESSLAKRIGVGLKLGYRAWEIEESNTDITLYSAAVRFTYHPLLVDKLDTYIGFTPILRYGTFVQENGNEFKWSTDISPVVGARYYIFESVGLSTEFAYDSSTNFTLGISFLFN